MKQISKIIVIFICILLMITPNKFCLSKVQAANIKRFHFNVVQKRKSIVLNWRPQKNVSYYKIFRINSTKYHFRCETPKEKNYKKIAFVPSCTTTYADRNVKNATKYCYIIKGYRKQTGKDKLVCSTFADFIFKCYTPGLDTPSFIPSSLAEDYENTLCKIPFGISPGDGMKPTGYIIYKKKVGRKSYKRVKLKKLANGDFLDRKLAPGSFYKYKVKSYIKIGKKKYFSKFSSPMTLDTIRYMGKYKVKMLTPGISNTSTLTFKVTSSSKYNGNTLFLSGATLSHGALYFYQSSKNSDELRYDFKLTKYSFNNRTWKNIPKKGILLKAKRTIYLQGILYHDELNTPATISFEESKPYQSLIRFGDALQYKDSKFYSEADFDFVTGIGTAHQEGD